MLTNRVRACYLGFTALCLVVAACSGSSDSASSSPPSIVDAGNGDVVVTQPSDDAGDAGLALTAMTFSYHPQWDGVVSVDVLGGFGQSNDWTSPLLTLASDGSGGFTGTAPALPSGSYPYLFRVTGDAAASAAKRVSFARYAVDPKDTAFTGCPSAAPTFTATVMNPCSLTGPAATTFHVRGVVDDNGAPISGYLVVIERDETGSHHQFVNRTTTGADGTFDLSVAPGSYRLQVLHPTYLSMTDAERTDPAALAAVRRTISSSVSVAADVQVNAAEVSFSTYTAMTPRGPSTLPTTFTFAVPDGAKAHAEVYGPGAEIGDPWWSAPVSTATSDVFDGGFNTGRAPDGGLKASTKYAWGVENLYAKPAGGTVSWTAQSMVLPVAWP